MSEQPRPCSYCEDGFIHDECNGSYPDPDPASPPDAADRLTELREALLGVRDDTQDVRDEIGIDDPEPCYCEAIWTDVPHSPECLRARKALRAAPREAQPSPQRSRLEAFQASVAAVERVAGETRQVGEARPSDVAELRAIVQRDQTDSECVTAVEDWLDRQLAVGEAQPDATGWVEGVIDGGDASEAHVYYLTVRFDTPPSTLPQSLRTMSTRVRVASAPSREREQP